MEPVNTDVSDGSAEGMNTDSITGGGVEQASGPPTLGTILLAVEELWPESLAEEWDEVGEEAVEWGAGLLITHHPLLLKGVTSVAATTAKGRAVHRLIESGTGLLTVHTNGDSAVGGVSEFGQPQPLTDYP